MREELVRRNYAASTIRTYLMAIEEFRRHAQKRLEHVTPHTLRHCFASHMLEAGTDLRTIQILMGHRDIEATARYLHVSPKLLRAAVNPIDQIPVSGPTNRQRSRKLHKPE
jgi:site-specific recombinase XerD